MLIVFLCIDDHLIFESAADFKLVVLILDMTGNEPVKHKITKSNSRAVLNRLYFYDIYKFLTSKGHVDQLARRKIIKIGVC